MTTYSTTQIIYAFSDSVGSAGGLSFDNSSGTGLATMQTYVTAVATAVLADTTIQGLIGSDWTPVWGPIVWADDTSGATVIADNTMGCYYSPSQNLFVIAIAGTNPTSPFDWLNEDFDVHTTVSWKDAGGTSGGSISAGSNAGLQILLKTMTNASGDTMLTALAAYIAANKTKRATIAVTGHSLGGALSPCVALYMHDNLDALGLHDQHLGAYPTAGPTPGDSDWALAYDALIVEGRITYASVYNTLDVVPLAWEPDELATVPAIYDADIVPTDTPADGFTGILASGLQLWALDSSHKNPYKQVSIHRTTLAGTFDTTVDGDVATKLKHVWWVLPGALKAYATTLTNVARFAAQAAAQHTIAYPPLLDIVAFDGEYQSIVKSHKPVAAAAIDPVAAAVLRLTKIDLDRVAAAGDAAAAAGAKG